MEQETQVLTTINQKKPNSKNIITILIIIILVIVATLIGYLLGSNVINSTNNILNNVDENSNITEEDDNTQNTSLDEVDTQSTIEEDEVITESNIYTNTLYGYKITLPSDWSSICGNAECGLDQASSEDSNPSFSPVNNSESYEIIMIDPIGTVQAGIPEAESINKKIINNISMTILEKEYTIQTGSTSYSYVAVNYIFEDVNDSNKLFTIFTRDNKERAYKDSIEKIVEIFTFL